MLVSFPVETAEQAYDSIVSYSELKEENARLKEKQLVDNIKLLKFEALENENIRLRGLLESSFKLGEQVLVAELLSVNLVPYEHVMVVNKGSRFGVHEKQAVLDANGIVGQVIRSLPLSSEVMLITDPNHAIPVQVNRNGLRTIAIGDGQANRLNLPFLPNNADILPGDLLVTSGLGGTFPQGYPVAVVDSFTAQPNKPFANISATPKAKLDRIRELLVVWSDSTPVPLTSSETESDQNESE
jgi:rod shape-determining protein MreC